MSELVSLTKDGEVAIITINNPPVNALSPGVPEGIRESIKDATEDPAVKAVVLIGGGRTFIAGADIREFGKMTSGEKKRDAVGLLPLLLEIEDCPKPTIAAIHGTAFGGGLEVAMAFHYRVAVPSAQVGQPEVKLGLIPGAGGTQRLPRLAGIPKAIEMCAQGDPVRAPEAHKLGIIDRIIEGDLLKGAVSFAREVAASGERPRKTRERNEKLQNLEPPVFAQAREALAKKARGQLAPFKAIDAIEAASRLSFEEGSRKEAELFRECLFSPQSKALIHVFFGERAITKIPDLPPDTPIREIKRAAVVGAGTMGGGIAMVYANAGIPVVLKETSQDLLDRGLEIIRKNYNNTMKKGRLTQEQMEQRLSLIKPALNYDGFDEVDIVVEAVFENLEIKKRVFGELNKVCRAEAILATNTSTLDIDQMAESTSRPRQVIGHHFFSPANVMRLLEIVRGKKSAPEVIATSMALAKKLGKVGVLVGNCRGFVGNRMLGPYRREAEFLLEEGATVEEVDRALTDFGMAMGPMAMSDLAGIDVGWRVRQEAKHLTDESQRSSNRIGDRLYALGRYGQKTGAGYYRYEPGNRTPIPDPEVEKIIEACAREAGIQRRKISSEEIVQRTIYALINEGAKILEEGIALRAVDIDIIYINGYGFPAYLGGPMWHADTIGLKKIFDRIREFEQQHGAHWKPAPLLKKLAEEGKTFN